MLLEEPISVGSFAAIVTASSDVIEFLMEFRVALVERVHLQVAGTCVFSG
jgi:hypothetical protein